MSKPDHSTNVEKIIANLLSQNEITEIFASPGSRNASVLQALDDEGGLHIHPVVDERQAAFNALGYSKVGQQPSALLCTSGTAPLNYAPAVAEAYYAGVPLIVITADRPAEWLGQDDSQTIDQRNIYANYIKRSFDIPVVDSPGAAWQANRLINEAILLASSGFPGPVHINVHISQPTASCKDDWSGHLVARKVEMTKTPEYMTVADVREMSKSLASPRKVMVVAGFLNPSSKLNRALSRLAAMPNVAVLTETNANLHSPLYISAIDRTLRCIPHEQLTDFLPDVVITLGGSLVSRRIKELLRHNPPAEHWYVGHCNNLIDCFQCLTRTIDVSPATFFEQLASAIQIHRQSSDYSRLWQHIFNQGQSILQAFVSHAPWSDMAAFSMILPKVPRNFNVQFSNGTPIRYSQLFSEHWFHRCDCNRGVSGIDGCLSTAVGAMLAYKQPTLIISGDTSAFYDMSVLGSPLIDHRMKIVVISNGGGGIFRFINATRNMPIREEYLSKIPPLPLESLARSFGFEYMKATTQEQLKAAIEDFISEKSRPVVLEIVTPADESAQTLSRFLNTNLTECLK